MIDGGAAAPDRIRAEGIVEIVIADTRSPPEVTALEPVRVTVGAH